MRNYLIFRTKNRPNVIVDVDSTLWDFTQEYYSRAKKISDSVLRPTEYDAWDSIHVGLDHETSHKIIDSIHEEQQKFTPFPFVRELLSFLSYDLNVIIASHRKPENIWSLISWLDKYMLSYDAVYTGWDKSELFDNKTALVIDDSPKVLTKAVGMDIPSYTIEYKYNANINGVAYFPDIGSMYRRLIWTLSHKDTR